MGHWSLQGMAPNESFHDGRTALRGTASFYRVRLRGLNQRGRTIGERVEAAQDLIGGVWDTGIGPVHYANGLDRQLTQLVTIGNVRNCLEYQMRTHCKSAFRRSVIDSDISARHCSLAMRARTAIDRIAISGIRLLRPSPVSVFRAPVGT
jgi:hypothetical protein